MGTWKRQFLEAGAAGLAAGGTKPSTREAQLEAEVTELPTVLGEAARRAGRGRGPPRPTRGRARAAARGAGRPRTRPDRVLGDTAYSSAGIRAHLRARGIRATIPVKDDQAADRRARGSAGGKLPSFDTVAYRDRNTVERCVARLKRYSAIALRTDERLYVFTGTVTVATLDLWPRDATRPDPSHTA